MRPAAVLGLLQGAIELVGGDGDAQGREVAEALTQEPFTLDGIVAGMVALEQLPRALRGAWQQRVPSDLVEADRVDDDFAFGDAHRKYLADVGPGHRVKVQPLGDEALDIDMAIDDLSGVEVAGGQRQELRLL